MSARTRCPVCGAPDGLRRSRPHGLWEKGLTRLAGIRAHRCQACDSRILHRGLPVGAPTRKPPTDDARARATFVPEAGTDEFDELIREIAAAEHRRPSGEPPAS